MKVKKHSLHIAQHIAKIRSRLMYLLVFNFREISKFLVGLRIDAKGNFGNPVLLARTNLEDTSDLI